MNKGVIYLVAYSYEKEKGFFVVVLLQKASIIPLRGSDTGVQYVQWNRTGALTLCKDHIQLVLLMFLLSRFESHWKD